MTTAEIPDILRVITANDVRAVFSMIRGRMVDKGTIYARMVYIDLNTVAGKQATLEAEIEDWQKARPRMSNLRKTNLHRMSGSNGRRMARRTEHQGWMHKVINNPTQHHPHPSYPIPYKKTNRRDK